MTPNQGMAAKWKPPNVATEPRSMGRNKETQAHPILGFIPPLTWHSSVESGVNVNDDEELHTGMMQPNVPHLLQRSASKLMSDSSSKNTNLGNLQGNTAIYSLS